MADGNIELAKYMKNVRHFQNAITKINRTCTLGGEGGCRALETIGKMSFLVDTLTIFDDEKLSGIGKETLIKLKKKEHVSRQDYICMFALSLYHKNIWEIGVRVGLDNLLYLNCIAFFVDTRSKYKTDICVELAPLTKFDTNKYGHYKERLFDCRYYRFSEELRCFGGKMNQIIRKRMNNFGFRLCRTFDFLLDAVNERFDQQKHDLANEMEEVNDWIEEVQFRVEGIETGSNVPGKGVEQIQFEKPSKTSKSVKDGIPTKTIEEGTEEAESDSGVESNNSSPKNSPSKGKNSPSKGKNSPKNSPSKGKKTEPNENDASANLFSTPSKPPRSANGGIMTPSSWVFDYAGKEKSPQPAALRNPIAPDGGPFRNMLTKQFGSDWAHETNMLLDDLDTMVSGENESSQFRITNILPWQYPTSLVAEEAGEEDEEEEDEDETGAAGSTPKKEEDEGEEEDKSEEVENQSDEEFVQEEEDDEDDEDCELEEDEDASEDSILETKESKPKSILKSKKVTVKEEPKTTIFRFPARKTRSATKPDVVDLLNEPSDSESSSELGKVVHVVRNCFSYFLTLPFQIRKRQQLRKRTLRRKPNRRKTNASAKHPKNRPSRISLPNKLNRRRNPRRQAEQRKKERAKTNKFVHLII